MPRERGWPVPVFARKDDTDACYERLIPLLLEHHAVIRPAFGTHNLRHVAMVMAEAEGRDRKSTRLNSSHLVISYAVFCLKKKKHTTIRQLVTQIPTVCAVHHSSVQHV